MGITGLIPFLEKASAKLHLKDIRGSTVAIDSYCWLHKGVFSCAEKLARGEDTDLYVQYCLKYVQMLLSYDIKPILVFDGQHLPAKALTEKRRRESRQQSKKRAAELLRLGRVEEARSQMRRCVDVTHEMALRLIQECRNRNVDCIVAPYEADAQMAWLNKADIAQYIITEDSDLTLFGAKKIIFKLDLTGAGLLVEADKLHLAMGCRLERYHFDKFRRMCILSGCDYLDSLPGIGLAKACKFMLKTEQDDMRKALRKIPQYLNMRQLEVDDVYIENFMKAEATFKHMFIYNPLQRRMERLFALEDFGTEETYCSNAGSLLGDSHQALHLALGNLNPFTLKQLDNWVPEKAKPAKHVKRAKHKSIWLTNFSNGQSDKDQPKSLQPTCALYFKKVDFASKTIDQEIEANQRIEQAKQSEAEVFTMYSCKTKRRRSSSSEEERERTPPPSPLQSKSWHNPFAKETMQRSPVVCENGSLLRLLSPKKDTAIKGAVEEKKVNALKRSIFAKEQVEVRSRFFSTHTTKTTQLEKEQPTKPFEDKEKLEDASSPHKKQRFSEDDNKTCSSKKTRKSKDLSEINNSEEESLPTASKKSRISLKPTLLEKDQMVTRNKSRLQAQSEQKSIDISPQSREPSLRLTTSPVSSLNSMKTIEILSLESTESDSNNNDGIILLSDDSCSSELTLPSSQEAGAVPTTLKLKDFQLPNARRVGLTKPKTAKKGAKPTSTNQPNQPKLSMFGFQKRPVLK